MQHVADKEMAENALGEQYDELAQPPAADVPLEHPLWADIDKVLREVYDPEIPVNIYELGLIYGVLIKDVEGEEGQHDIEVVMSLTSPACPVAQEMPSWVQNAIFPIEGVRHVDVEIIWDPPWDPSMMAETAKLQLNMFSY